MEKKYYEELNKMLRQFPKKDAQGLALALNLLKHCSSKLDLDDSSKMQSEEKRPKNIGDILFSLYSDGACRGNPGPGAFGVVGFCGKEEIFVSTGIDVRTTNNRMELEGVIHACDQLEIYLDHTYPKLSYDQIIVDVYTDSQYVVNGANQWMKNWKANDWGKKGGTEPKNLDLWLRIDEIKSAYPNLKLHWVRGHSGHPMNERCDALANQALDEAGF